MSLATLIGMVGPAVTYLGGDSAVHLSEELSDASHVLPRAMVCAATVNYITGFAMTVTLMSNLGDLDADLMSRTGQPWVAVIRSVTGSRVATIVLLIVMIFMVCRDQIQAWHEEDARLIQWQYFFCAVNQVTTSARQIFAFARDRGETNTSQMKLRSKRLIPSLQASHFLDSLPALILIPAFPQTPST